MSRVLVIDDDPLIRGQFLAILNHAGHETSAAECGRVCLAQFSAGEPDVVVVDILMPEFDGLETIGALRSFHPDVAIVAVSGGGMTGGLLYLRLASLLGADVTLEKPVWPAQLVAAVSEAVSTRRLRPRGRTRASSCRGSSA